MKLKNRLFSFLGSTPAQFLSRLVLGGLFIYASLDKIAHPEAFAKIISNYKLLPQFLINFFAVVLPWMEMISGILLVFNRFTRSAAIILSGLLLVFIAAIGINAIRGLDVTCGCFSTSSGEAESWYVLVSRDLIFLIPGLVIILYHRRNTGQTQMERT
jgi:uncharacterized membrane protein YphA (DoxX/SURF4 family)